jgi:hypothetical protein
MRQIMRQINFNGVAERVSQKILYYKRELRLSGKQEEEVYPIFLSDQLDKDECLRTCGRRRSGGDKLTRDQVRERFASMNEERAKKLRPILTDAQWTKFRELEARRQSWPSAPEDPRFPRGPAEPPLPLAPGPAVPGDRPAAP